MSSDALKVIYK